MLTLLVPILISFLQDQNQLHGKNKSKYLVQLHEQSLQWLMKIGPKYPEVVFSHSQNLFLYKFFSLIFFYNFFFVSKKINYRSSRD